MKGFVYKIANQDDSIVYVGSTIQSVSDRWKSHLKNYKQWVAGNGSSCSIFYHFKEFGFEAFTITALSEHELESREQLKQFEQLVILANACVNQRAAYRSYEDQLRYNQQYRRNNRDRINAHMSEKLTCACGSIVSRRNISYHKKSKKHDKLMNAAF